MAEGPGQRAHRRVGTMIRDKYRIDAFIATGSMANVYAATHRNGSRVALKILHRELARDPAMAERFRREGYFANAIGHPGVVRAIDDDVAEDGCVFIVMELLEGENLEERRQRMGGKIPLGEALQITDAMLDVLSAAHDHEVLHRDLKPENVFITRKNEVKLLDFGVARFNDGRSSSDMTGVGMVLGTPAFMSPEQALGRREQVDARSDIWSVGATLFTVIAGESVHLGGDAKTKLIATARTPARPIRDVVPDVPRAVASVIDRALAFDKAERWADANAMREALRWARMSLDGSGGAQLEPPDEVHPPPVPTRRTPERDDEPTLAGRSLTTTQSWGSRDASFDDSTAKRGPLHGLDPLYPTGDDVFTSAPPVTQRDVPPSMAMSEDPTFSLRNDPVFSLRRPAEPVPTTERMPQPAPPAPAVPDRSDASTADRPLPPLVPEGQSEADAAALFRAALANTGFVPDDGSKIPPKFASTVPLAQGSAPPPAGTPHPAGGPPSVTPENPGPLLATIVPTEQKSSGAFRVLVPILIGIVAGVTTYTIVVRQRAAIVNQGAAPAATAPAPTSAAPSVSVPAEAASSAPSVTPSAYVASPPASSASITPSSSAPPPKKTRPKPRPKPPAAASTAAETPTAEPLPAPIESLSKDPD